MKYTKPLFFLAILFVANGLLASDTIPRPKKLMSEPQHAPSEMLIADILQHYHYQKAKIDNDFSAKVFDKYLKMLDMQRLYFLKSDIKHFEQYRLMLDDELLTGQCAIGYEMYNKYIDRLQERLDFTDKLLKDTFDFSTDEYYTYDHENQSWFEDTEDQNRYWTKRLKYEGLSLKLGNKHGKDITDILQKRYSNFRKQLAKAKNEDAFQTYMNAFAGVVDPHTDYFSPSVADNFNVEMSQKLEGIGATLSTEGDYTKVRELVKGAPAERSKKLFAGDKITAVGQGRDSKDGEMVDVVGWRIDDVVSLIRGKKDTWVRLQIISAKAAPGEPQKIIEILRDEVKIEDQRAKGEIKKIRQGKKELNIGVINLPVFYKGTSTDLKKLIEGFKKERLDGIVMDLRNNTGGSLQEAIWLSGLFIKQGPVVQVKNAVGSIDVNYDEDESVYWDGPMTVIVNRGSASASEIFAAAMQDYGRAIIVGDQTFGKGTVQNVFPLDRMGFKTEEKLGQVKLTIAKFYRINGASTQHRGVIPDILIPTTYDTAEFGESSEDYALAYDEIPVADYAATAQVAAMMAKCRDNHEARMKTNKDYQYLLEDIKYLTQQREEKMLPLGETAAKAKQKAREDAVKGRKSNIDDEDGEEESKPKDKDKPKEAKKDFILDEGLAILGDIIQISGLAKK